MSYESNFENLKLSIGLPVYNGEKFLRKCLDSLLTQTFTNFELIISDNASTDSTSTICQEYAKNDKRIRYIHQQKNIGLLQNFHFVLQEAKNDFFMWIGSDDFLLPDYIKKNLQVLSSNSHIVGSVSKIDQYNIPDSGTNPIDSKFVNFIKKLRMRFRKREAFSISGTYEQKVRSYLMNSTCQVIYGIFRTDKLRKSIVNSLFVGLDWAEILSVLKYGDIHVVDEILMYEFEGGRSIGGILHISQTYNPNTLSVIFPWYPFSNACVKILGVKIFFKNIDYFIKLNFEGFVSQIIDMTRILTHRFLRK